MKSSLVNSRYVDPSDYSIVTFSIKAMKMGNMLIFAPNAGWLDFDVHMDNVRAMFDEIYRTNQANSLQNLPPFPPSFSFTTRRGTFIIDAQILEELSSSMFGVIIDRDLHEDTLKDFQPE